MRALVWVKALRTGSIENVDASWKSPSTFFVDGRSFTHWLGGVMELVSECNSRVVLNWIDIPIARPRVWWETVLELEQEVNSLATLLEIEGAYRTELFKD
ncbi:hypothetical protein V6N12_009899 [Hibiscus sabdariffa]|uniref:Uncharacterized protein n=1 Tax=Hibiscus sabdariffa TaxID=183260 RepID=A0ABR2EC55_9ROSI